MSQVLSFGSDMFQTNSKEKPEDHMGNHHCSLGSYRYLLNLYLTGQEASTLIKGNLQDSQMVNLYIFCVHSCVCSNLLCDHVLLTPVCLNHARAKRAESPSAFIYHSEESHIVFVCCRITISYLVSEWNCYLSDRKKGSAYVLKVSGVLL